MAHVLSHTETHYTFQDKRIVYADVYNSTKLSNRTLKNTVTINKE